MTSPYRQHRVNEGWFRGETVNFLPSIPALLGPGATEKYILHGWLPPSPILHRDTGVLTFGSCFAVNVAYFLAQHGFTMTTGQSEAERQSMVVLMNEGIVNTFTSRQMLEWAFDNKPLKVDVWHDKAGESLGQRESTRVATRAIFERAGAFIITLGLAEVWYDKLTGEVFSRAIPESAYDADRHGFRVSTVSENLDNLRAIHALLRRVRPDAPIIFTLSPVPLMATFRPVSCITANSVSKAILRVAVDELMREGHPNLYYWPSYEIVTAQFQNTFAEDNRHPKSDVIEFIMATFARHFCAADDLPDPERAYFRVLEATGVIPKRLVQRLQKDAAEPALELIDKLIRDKQVELALVCLDQAQRQWGELSTIVEQRSRCHSQMRKRKNRSLTRADGPQENPTTRGVGWGVTELKDEPPRRR